MKRPFWISVIAVLGMIGGVCGVIIGILGLALGAMISTFWSALAGSGAGSLGPPYMALLGFLVLGLSVYAFAVGVGLWRLQRWAWILYVLGTILGLFYDLVTFSASSILGIIFGLIVLVYFISRSDRFGFRRGRVHDLKEALPIK
jgi:hypothetical protein